MDLKTRWQTDEDVVLLPGARVGRDCIVGVGAAAYVKRKELYR